MKKIIFACLILSMCFQSAFAKELKYVPDKTCRSAITESEILSCMKTEFNHYDFLLKRYYELTLEYLSKQDAIEFKKSQEAWQKYKDLNCSFLHKFESKSLKKIMKLACGILKSKNRYSELRSFYLKLGGDDALVVKKE